MTIMMLLAGLICGGNLRNNSGDANSEDKLASANENFQSIMNLC